MRPVPDSDRVFFAGQRGAEIIVGRTALINFTVVEESDDNEFEFELPKQKGEPKRVLRPGDSYKNVEFLTSQQLRITNAALDNAGNYRLIVSNLARPVNKDKSVTKLRVYS